MGWKLFRVMRHNQYATLPVLPSGALALPTDSGRLYVSNGARWVDPSELPIGAPYTRMPGDPLPSAVWPGTTWTKVSGSGNLAGTFPRFDGQYSGHEASTYNVVQTSQNKAHSHGGATGGMSANNPHTHGANTYSSGSTGYAMNGGGGTWYDASGIVKTADIAHTHAVYSDGGTEARPVAVGIEHYRRAA